MPARQLASSPELTPPPACAGANERLCLLNVSTPRLRHQRDRGAIMGASMQRQTIPPAAAVASNVIAHGATWSSERVEQLRVCFGAGLSCSQIAAQIGVSRNAVIGKMNRLGLSRPRSTRAKAPDAERAAWRARSRGSNVTRIFSQHRILVELPPEPPGGAAVVSIHGGRGCSLLELSPGKCRWPVSEPGAQDFCFCGNPQVEGLPYCVGHARIAYKSAARARTSAPV
jgi:GcrA cell cycle regulator